MLVISVREHATALIKLYARLYIYIADILSRVVSKCTELLNEAGLVKIAKSNIIPTLRGFHWYWYFMSQVYLETFEEAYDAVAFN